MALATLETSVTGPAIIERRDGARVVAAVALPAAVRDDVAAGASISLAFGTNSSLNLIVEGPETDVSTVSDLTARSNGPVVVVRALTVGSSSAEPGMRGTGRLRLPRERVATLLIPPLRGVLAGTQ
jgi:hypothetical protein